MLNVVVGAVIVEELVVVVGVGPVGVVIGAFCGLLYLAAFEDIEGVCNAVELLSRGTGFLTPDLDEVVVVV